jgi:hypothetical protein
MENKIRISPNLIMSQFRADCREEIDNYLKWLRDSLNL